MSSSPSLPAFQPRQAKYELCRRHFWEYCKAIAPDFYTEDRPHLKTIAQTLQQLYEGKLLKPDGTPYKKLMLNIPPQHGKSRTLINFSNWVFGKNSAEKIITCSYNDSTASDFSRYTRNGITASKNEDSQTVFSDVFPKVRIKQGNSSFEKWALEGHHFSYLGAGIGGSITSKGGTILIVDDPVKGAIEALNEAELERIWLWYTSTFLSRVSAPGGEPIEIICMTRWSKNDICGKILDGPGASEWYVLKMEATDKNNPGVMLCYSLFGYKRYLGQKSMVHEGIFNANYHQEAIELEGVLFKRKALKRFALKDLKLFEMRDGIKTPLYETCLGYCDVKDEGDDFLCFVFGYIMGDKVFITDVIYSSDTVDITVPQSAALIKSLQANYVRIEKNNQGGGFVRDLRRLIDPGKIWTITNTKQKVVRIWNEYGFIMNYCYFMQDSDIVPGSDYAKFIDNFVSYMKDGSSAHDDGADAMAGLAKFIQQSLPNLFNGTGV